LKNTVTCHLRSQPIERFITRQQLRNTQQVLEKLLGSRPRVTMEAQLEAVFSMWSAPRLYHASDSSILGSSERDIFEYSSSSERYIFEYSGSSERVIVEFEELANCEQCSVKKELPAQNLQLCIVKL
jgi:aminopeptidase-like protein